MKRLFYFTLVIVAGLMTVACDKDDDDDQDDQGVNTGSIHPNRIIFNIVDKLDSTNSGSFELYDTDGVGGNAPQVIDSIYFRVEPTSSGATYNGSLQFFENTNEVTSQIAALSDKYMICYRDFDFNELAVGLLDKDQNNIQLGLNGEWFAKIKNRAGRIRITMNYNIQPKDGTCNAGVRVYEGYIPYRILNR